MFSFVNENVIIDTVKEHIKNDIKSILIDDLSEPNETYEVENESGVLFLKSLGVNPSEVKAQTMLGNGYQDFIYGVQIVIAMPEDITERAILDLSYEVRLAMANYPIDKLSNFNDGFKLINAQPVTHDAGNYQAKVMTFNITITEEV